MRAMRWMTVAAAVAACGEDPKPLTGQAAWTDACPMSSCPPVPHNIAGAQGSPTVDVACSIRQVSGGYDVEFRIAAISMAGQNFADSNEGLYVTGLLPAVGQELRPQGSVGYVTIKGLGWTVPNATIGPSTGKCHVFIDAIAAGGFRGRIACADLRDDRSPPTTRLVRGGASAMNPDFGEFVFTNCGGG